MKAQLALLVTGLLAFSSSLFAEPVEIGGLKSTPPKEWVVEKTTSDMRLAQFKVPKAEGDKEDAELVIFFFKSGSGSEDDNLARQAKGFEPAEGKEKVESKTDKVKVGSKEYTVLDLKGTYLSKFPPFAPNPKITKKTDYRQLYVIFKNDSGEFYFRLLGPAKTVEENKKGFEEFLKNFK